MSRPGGARLALDEMFAPRIAEALRERGHDAVGVVERTDLRAMADDAVFAWACAEGRWLLTENVKDFRPIMMRALETGQPISGLLFTSSRSFSRSRRNPGPLVEALHAWLAKGPPSAPLTEDWL